MLDLLELLLNIGAVWRIALGCGLALALVAAANAVYPVPAGAWFLLGFVGASVGGVWQAAAASKQAPSPPVTPGRRPRLPSALAFLTVAAIGGLWGYLAELAFGRTFAVLCMLLGPPLLAPVFGILSKERLSPFSVVLASAACLLGYATPHAINLFFQSTGA
ncbi:hypothetical protein ACFPOE_13560 [Caenimonas terrae]|uniref:Tripartite tricarboxylate transporter TctB family protein n=1 Tax=Caenimonas terrae TaxID=696074 RepID=A0ABW0NG41_9BURK